MDLKATVVLNEAEFSKLVHKETDSRSGCAYHFRKRFLAYFRNDCFGVAFFSKVREQQKNSREPLFAGVEELVNEVFFDTYIARQEMLHEEFRK